MKKGAVNVAEEWIGGLQKPNGLNCQPRAGYRRCQGESARTNVNARWSWCWNPLYGSDTARTGGRSQSLVDAGW